MRGVWRRVVGALFVAAAVGCGSSDTTQTRDAAPGADAYVPGDAAHTGDANTVGDGGIDPDAASLGDAASADDAGSMSSDGGLVRVDPDAESGTLGANEDLLQGPLSVVIDPTLPRVIDALPDNSDGTARTTGAMTWSNLPATTFVENELVVLGTMDEINGVASRWDGAVIETVTLPAFDPAPEQVLARLHIVPPEADTQTFVDNHMRVQDISQGQASFSSTAAFDTLAAAYAEMAAGVTVAVNPVAQGTDILSGSTLEIDGFPSVEGFTYVPDAFQYPYARRRSTAWRGGTGVAEAVRNMWTLGMRPTGDGRVRVAIIDSGFATAPTPDFAAIWPIKRSLESGMAATNTRNVARCSGGADCPWHGTGVMQAALSPWNDSLGGAGGAAGFGLAATYHTNYDWFATVNATADAAMAQGVRVVNMSYGGGLSVLFRSVQLPFEVALYRIRNAYNVNIVAAAGNDNLDVNESVLGIDTMVWWPCESADVFCIGASDWQAGRRPFSNWASDQRSVDIFAPDGQYVAVPATSSPTSMTIGQSQMGTSLSAPWVSGVIALMRTANASLTNSEVESILRSTAFTVSDTRVGKIVDAEAAITEALARRGSTIAAPTVQIVAPDTGTYMGPHGQIGFYADGAQAGDIGCCTYHWSTVTPGVPAFPDAQSFITRLGPGVHYVSVVAENVRGLRSAPATLRLTLLNGAPSAGMIPTGTMTVGMPVVFQSAVYDPNGPEDVPCSNVFWSTTPECPADDERLHDRFGGFHAVSGCEFGFMLWDEWSDETECATIQLQARDRYGAMSTLQTRTFYPESMTGPRITIYLEEPRTEPLLLIDHLYDFRSTIYSEVMTPMYFWSLNPLGEDGFPTGDHHVFWNEQDGEDVSIASIREFLDPVLCVRPEGQRAWLVVRVTGAGEASGSDIVTVRIGCPPV